MHKNDKDRYIEVQKNRIDLYFKYNLKEYHSITINNVDKNPMGDYFISGYINNDKKYKFEALMSSLDHFQFNGDMSYNPQIFGKLFKNEDHKDELTPNDIIKKENLNKKHYEAKPPLFWGF
ncbi:DUF1433 domain-containing protein [Staphylococcus sp. Marseille-Q5304]|uniref:DUF1433 domain-containing protein n=1 Tax=Staphylococcus sp. Marseille-Q5304 TaxID=2942200 RepID=UPI002073B377|nr:DUF1433 domain-containing protein [Staphylococcus sp. Marseille-Q5304]